MLVVRKEGKAHHRYNSFRSAFELLEAVGREPHDCFDEKSQDLPPLQMLEQRMQQQIDRLMSENELMKKSMELMKNNMELVKDNMQQQIDNLCSENEILRSRLT